MVDREFWKNRRVMVTGHTGFKGGWLTFILSKLGSDVSGYALDADSDQGSYRTLSNGSVCSVIADIRDKVAFSRAISDFAPEIVIHMAAQPLVLASIQDPHATFSTNIQGTETVLDALRFEECVKVLVNVTTDKVYENSGSGEAFVESDPLGGKDPYSASKACSDLLTTSYYQTFLQEKGLGIATARAGNVIGGGDWACDRIVPDFFRAAASGGILTLRNPSFVRPWQHVFEPLFGYLLLCEKLFWNPGKYSGAWNFGPDPKNRYSVSEVVSWFNTSIPSPVNIKEDMYGSSVEAQTLTLNSVKAQKGLGWKACLSLDQTLELTQSWYSKQISGGDMVLHSEEQLTWFLDRFKEETE